MFMPPKPVQAASLWPPAPPPMRPRNSPTERLPLWSTSSFWKSSCIAFL